MKTNSLWFAATLGLGFAAALLVLTHPAPIAQAGGIVHYVAEGGTSITCTAPLAPCGSIQRAINLAAPAGDVWVATGVYTENLVITSGVSLCGGWDVSFTVQSPITYPTVVDGGGTYVVSATTSVYPITLSGMTLRNGSDGIHLYGGGSAPSQRLSGNRAGGGSGDLAVVNSLIYSMTSQAIEVETGTVLIEGNVFWGTGGEGIKINGGVADVRSNTVHGTGQHGIRVQGGSATIAGNVVYDVRNTRHGIRVQTSATVAANRVYSITDRGIDAENGAVTITDNLVYDTDGDGIRTDDTSTAVSIRGNTVYSTGNDGIDARGVTVVVAGNAVSGCADNGIKSEDIGAWVDIERNRVFDNATVGIAIRQAPVFTLTNNVVGSNVGASVELGGTGSGFIYHNTLVGSEAGVQGNGIVVQSPLAITLANNIVVSHSAGISATAGAVLVVSNTLLWGNGSDPILGASVITRAPAFVAPAQRDYHILLESPAVNAGVSVGVLTDMDGEPRLGAPDVGADEVTRKVYLPLVMRTQPPTNQALNPGFEGLSCRPGSVPPQCLDNWTRDTFDGVPYADIFTPQGWVSWWRTGGSYGLPSVEVIPNEPPFTGERPRIYGGYYATRVYISWNIMDAGLFQTVTGLTPGATVQFSAYGHTWSCTSINGDNGLASSCGGENMTMQLGIDPGGSQDFNSPSIVWSSEQSARDTYALIGPVIAQAGPGGSVTVFLRAKSQWGYQFQEAYWDDASLVIW